MSEVFVVERENIVHHLKNLIGERSPFHNEWRNAKTADYIQSEFERYGLRVEIDHFSFWGTTYFNLIGHLNYKEDIPITLMAAHFDTVVGSPGADDNASGVAVLLETVRVISKLKPHAPIQFAAFNLEEVLMQGSKHYAKKLRKQKVSLRGMFSLEMVGFTDKRPGRQKYPPGLKYFYPNVGDFISIVGNFRSQKFLKEFAHSMKKIPGLGVETLSVPGNGWLVPATRLSDHSPFWDVGYPAVMVTDTAFYRNPHYHLPTDTFETLDLDFIEKVTKGSIQLLSDISL